MRFLGQWGIWIVLSHPPEGGPVNPHSHQHQGGSPELPSVLHWLTVASPPSLPSSWPSRLCVHPLCLGRLCSRAFHGCLLITKPSGWGNLLAHLSEVLEMSQCPAPFLFRALSILCKRYTQTLLVHCFVASCFWGAGFILGCGGWVCIVDCGVASLASTHWMPVPCAPPEVTTKNDFRHCQNVVGETRESLTPC